MKEPLRVRYMVPLESDTTKNPAPWTARSVVVEVETTLPWSALSETWLVETPAKFASLVET